MSYYTFTVDFSYVTMPKYLQTRGYQKKKKKKKKERKNKDQLEKELVKDIKIFSKK